MNFLFFHGFEFFFQVLGVFLGIVHFIDAVLAFMEYRKFKVQIIRGNVVWMIMILCQIMQESNKNREKTWELPQIWIAVMRTVWTLIWTTNFTNAQNVEWSGVESPYEKSFRSERFQNDGLTSSSQIGNWKISSHLKKKMKKNLRKIKSRKKYTTEKRKEKSYQRK